MSTEPWAEGDAVFFPGPPPDPTAVPVDVSGWPVLGATRDSEPPPGVSPHRVVYLLWSNKHSAWWRPGDRGYTTEVEEAGRYSRTQAIDRVVQSAWAGQLDQVTAMVAAPENWPPASDARTNDAGQPTATVDAQPD